MSRREVVIYTTMFCPYCRNAKSLLDEKGVGYQEIPVDGDREARLAMSRRAGGRTSVPQIFVGDNHIGGSDELCALDRTGKLDAILHEQIA